MKLVTIIIMEKGKKKKLNKKSVDQQQIKKRNKYYAKNIMYRSYPISHLYNYSN